MLSHTTPSDTGHLTGKCAKRHILPLHLTDGIRLRHRAIVKLMNVIQNAVAPDLIPERCQLSIDCEQLREIPQSKHRVFVQITIVKIIRSMIVLVEEGQIIRPWNVTRSSEQSETEARSVRCDRSELTITCDYVVIEKLVQALRHFLQCWRRRIDQRCGKERTQEWAWFVKRALSMSDNAGGDQYD